MAPKTSSGWGVGVRVGGAVALVKDRRGVLKRNVLICFSTTSKLSRLII